MVADLLSENIFIEDVRVEHATDRWYRIGLHGPQVPAVLASWGGCPDSPLQVSPLDIDGVEVLAIRQDLAATTGCELLLPRPAALDVWTAIRQRAQIVGVGTRTVGWYAFNTARLEGGTPLFNIDFGPTNLPHETGLFQDCVSLTKGCYPGQEIVARMENLGSPKQQVRGLRMTNESLPVAGAQVYAADDDALAQPVGVVTSSAASPLLSGHPVVLAMVRKRVVAEGTAVRVHVEGQPCEATVQGLDPLQQPRTPPETSS
jgi:folate-binding protein YgfZ